MESLILLLFLMVLALPLLLGARRQKRALREAQELQSSLEVGNLVMTTSGPVSYTHLTLPTKRIV